MGRKRGQNSGTSSLIVTPESKTPESKRPAQRMTPETRRLSFTSVTSMTGARPKIIRTSFDVSTGRYEFSPLSVARRDLKSIMLIETLF